MQPRCSGASSLILLTLHSHTLNTIPFIADKTRPRMVSRSRCTATFLYNRYKKMIALPVSVSTWLVVGACFTLRSPVVTLWWRQQQVVKHMTPQKRWPDVGYLGTRSLKVQKEKNKDRSVFTLIDALETCIQILLLTPCCRKCPSSQLISSPV